ncbi:MAG: hypothetical protein N2517_01245 [Ignavibacteria bacterium]|nr:hypothetical protein [Ignavibacteria bacterium]
MKMFRLFCLVILLSFNLFGNDSRKTLPVRAGSDTTIIFSSPKPLIENDVIFNKSQRFWGLSLVLSNSGFGFGAFYEFNILPNTTFFANLYISGARNTDEFEYYDPWTGRIFIPNKVNRLYMFPLTFGLKHYFLTDVLFPNFSPYVNFGVGPTFIFASPYNKEFFTSLKYLDTYIRFGSFLGCGFDIPTSDKSALGVSARYYWIPFGGRGLESIKDKPITDFGGLFLALSLVISI